MKIFLTGLLLCLCPLLHAMDQFENSFYLHLGLGEHEVPTADINRQFDLSASGGLDPQTSDSWVFNGDFAVGYQSPYLFGVEVGLNGGQGLVSNPLTILGGGSVNTPDYSTSVTGGYPSNTQQFTDDFTMTTIYVMPTIRIPMDGFLGRPCIHTLGFRIGTSTLSGDVTSPYTAYSYNPYTDAETSYTAYNQDEIIAQATSYGVCYRLEQMLGGRCSLGLELAYQWVTFSPEFGETVGEGYAQAIRVDRSPLTLNLSGPSIKLSIGFWPMRPFKNAADIAADAAAKALRKKEKMAESHFSNFDVDAEMASRLVARGDALLEQKSYAVAAEIYQQAASSDQSNRWAWQGLGNSYYYLNRMPEALQAYQKAAAIAPDDEKLGKIIEKLGGSPPGPPAP